MPPFDNDARMRELMYLAKLDRLGHGMDVDMRANRDTPERRMVLYLIEHGYVNDPSVTSWSDYDNVFTERFNKYLEKHERERWRDYTRILNGQTVRVRISHKGSLRVAELEQQIKADRERDPFGIVLAGRYWERDLTIALLHASAQTPVAVVFADMNGLKAINDGIDHAAGDLAIKTYLNEVANAVDEVGEAYRVGGDEVVAILPGVPERRARDIMHAMLRSLGEANALDGRRLTASVGIALATDPAETAADVRARADKAQYQAKAASRGNERRSALAVGDEQAPIVL